MTPTEAAQLLELPAGATADAIESRFLELRTKLESKIGQAPTPGLKEKYRASLAQVTEAFETLTLAADSSSLPVRQKAAALPLPSPTAPATTAAAPRAAKRAKQSGNKEFIMVAFIAAIVLLAGGYWVISARAENERKARAAVEAKAEAEKEAALEKQLEDERKQKLAAAEKIEKARLDALFLRQRSRLIELNLAYEALLRTEQGANRVLSDLRSQQSDLRGAVTAETIEIKNKVKAQEMYLRWLGDYLPGNPAQVAKGRAEAALSDRNEAAAELVDAYAAAIAALKVELNANQCDPATVAALDGQRRMADQGDATAMNWLSYVYFDAAGVPRDEALGVQWAQKAAARGVPRAQQRLGEAYREGRGVAKDPALSFSWYLKAAEQDDTTGYFYVAYAYLSGEGVAKDVPAAITWFEKSAAKGEPAAMINLATIDFDAGNATQAVEWLKKAVTTNNSPAALSMLGRIYLGLLYPKAGVPLDEAGGIDYLQQAARLEDPRAKEILLQRSLTW